MQLSSLSRQVARLLKQREQRIVFAESCTAGLVAASLSRVPGISSWLCGSMVTYRNEEKAAWLGISPALLQDPGPVSEIVARQMVEQVLQRTDDATFAAAVTGHLGPNAPADLDGVVFIATACRNTGPGEFSPTQVHLYRCQTEPRYARQREVVQQVLQTVVQRLH